MFGCLSGFGLNRSVGICDRERDVLVSLGGGQPEAFERHRAAAFPVMAALLDGSLAHMRQQCQHTLLTSAPTPPELTQNKEADRL